MSDEDVTKGAFLESLIRTNSKIKKDRAEAIGESTQVLFKRAVEDLDIEIKQMKREQESMMDLSPESATSLILASDFDSADYVKRDVDLGVKIHNTTIKLEIAKKRYEYLFGSM